MTTRRRFIEGTAMTLAAASLARSAHAADFPEHAFDVVIPTREGGGADRLFRAFAAVWKNHIGQDFEAGFFPGASGAVGYEVFVGKREADGHNLLFGNMGPELAVMVVQEGSYSYPEDFEYFCSLDVDPGVLFVAADSPFQTIDDVVAEGKKRMLNVSTSRLPHPASIGALLLAEHTGAQFNLVPLSGGRNTIAGVVTGEVELGVLPSGSVAGAGDSVRTLLVWNKANPIPGQLSNAPTMNGHFGTSYPDMNSSRAFAVHSSVITQHADRFGKLVSTSKAAFDDPAFKEAALAAGQPVELLEHGDLETCRANAKAMLALARKYKGLLTGKA